jgi:hypothetical protein
MSLVDHLVVQLLDVPPLTGRYDEQRCYTVDRGGRPLVGETHEITEVAGERDEPTPAEPRRPDPDLPPQTQPDTVRTFVEREVDDASDAAWRAYMTRTETTVRRELPDYDG